jgi:hypothetical protein
VPDRGELASRGKAHTSEDLKRRVIEAFLEVS